MTHVNCVVVGKAPNEIAPFLYVAPFIALNKEGGFLRLIIACESLRHLVLKCCCFVLSDETKSFFVSLHVGIATIKGVEASIHEVR